jgi:hypothetical protein
MPSRGKEHVHGVKAMRLVKSRDVGMNTKIASHTSPKIRAYTTGGFMQRYLMLTK